MIRNQDLSVLISYFLGYSKIRNWILRICGEAVTTIVTFHDIPLETIEQFKAKMVFLKKRTNVISIDDYMLGNVSSKKINTIITFDDGYKGWVTNAIPVLKKLELPATFFISSGFVGLSKEMQKEFIKSKLMVDKNWDKITGCLSQEDINKMAVDGFSIGGHTLNHSVLAKLKDQESLMHEIAEDKKNLEAFSGQNIHYFSYPCGAHINTEIDLISILKKCGFTGAVTLISGFNKANTNPFLLQRELTSAQISNIVFQARVFGNNHLINMIKELLATAFQR